MSIASADAHHDAVQLRDRGVRTTAEVIQVHKGRGASVDLTFVDTTGQRVTAEDVGNYLWDPDPRVGDRPRIIYDPDCPECLVADSRLGPDFVAPLLLGGGAVAAWVAAPLTWFGVIDWRRRR